MALSKLAVRRLTKLADYMDSLPEKAANHFYMGAWMQHEGDHAFEPEAITTDALMDCGATACAAGWACSVPEFSSNGLTMVHAQGWNGTQYWVVRFREYSDDDAVMRFFGVPDWSIHEQLFHAYEINSPKQWANHCRKVIRENS